LIAGRIMAKGLPIDRAMVELSLAYAPDRSACWSVGRVCLQQRGPRFYSLLGLTFPPFCLLWQLGQFASH
jgi:hypothetical protein